MLLRSQDKYRLRIINHRTVGNMLAVEFLNELYNQFDYEVNPYRFRHTLIKSSFDANGNINVESYTTVEHWDFLVQFLNHEMTHHPEEFYARVDGYIRIPKVKVPALKARLQGASFDGGSALEIFNQLVELHYTCLKEIYRINLVQLEYAIGEYIQWRIGQDTGDPAGAGRIFAEMITAGVKINAAQEDAELFALAKRIRDAGGDLAGFRPELQAIHDKYKGMAVAYGADTLPFPDYEAHFGKLIEASLDWFDERHQLAVAEIAVPERAYGLSKLTRDYLELYIRMGELRDNNKALLGSVMIYRQKLLQALCNVTGESYANIKCYLYADLHRLVRAGEKLDPAIVQERRTVPMLMVRNECLVHGIDVLTAQIPYEFPYTSRSVDMVRGQIASTGKVRGAVRIVNTKNDAHKMNPGDILVSIGTDFDLMGAMRMAGGIITEEGGFLSHASVRSREMQIPCLIGVPRATKVLQDGDTVLLECNDEGVVAILERAGAATAKREPRGNVRLLQGSEPSSRYGNKLTGLFELDRAGILVPPTLGVPDHYDNLSEDLDEAIDELGAALAEHPDYTWLCSTPGFHGPVILRSSTSVEDGQEASHAGEFESPVVSHPGPETLAAAIKRLIRSARDTFSSQNLRGGYIGVAIQPHMAFDVAGVAFNVDPITREEQLIVEYARGGNESITSGTRLADRITRYDAARTRERQELYERIGAAIDEIYSLYNYPIDMEWGIAGDTLIVLQARRAILKDA